jgi:hypothetical protein
MSVDDILGAGFMNAEDGSVRTPCNSSGTTLIASIGPSVTV